MSEGLDFSDSNGRAVIITGLPYPSLADAKVRLKRQHLDELRNKLPPGAPERPVVTGQEWYTQQASRAVNQSCGRIIRHVGDYGAVILADERFGQNNWSGQLSAWMRPYLKRYAKFGEFVGSISKFFQAANVHKNPAVKSALPVSTSTIPRPVLGASNIPRPPVGLKKEEKPLAPKLNVHNQAVSKPPPVTPSREVSSCEYQ